MNLTQVLKDQLDKEGALLDNANADEKGLRTAIQSAREIRKTLAVTIRNIKRQIKDADRAGTNKHAAALQRSLAFFREQYIDFFEEQMMYKAQLAAVIKFIANQKPIVLALDAEWEKSKSEAQ